MNTNFVSRWVMPLMLCAVALTSAAATSQAATATKMGISFADLRYSRGDVVAITLTLKDAVTGQPIAGQSVRLYKNSTRPGYVGSGVTDCYGTVRINFRVPLDPNDDWQWMSGQYAGCPALGLLPSCSVEKRVRIG